jgi:hypothetical protein
MDMPNDSLTESERTPRRLADPSSALDAYRTGDGPRSFLPGEVPNSGMHQPLRFGDQQLNSASDIFDEKSLKELFPNASADELAKIDIAHTASQALDIGLKRFSSLAGADDQLSVSEITDYLRSPDSDKHPREKDALQDLLRHMDQLESPSLIDQVLFREPYVTFTGLNNKLLGELAPELKAIDEMKESQK